MYLSVFVAAPLHYVQKSYKQTNKVQNVIIYTRSRPGQVQLKTGLRVLDCWKAVWDQIKKRLLWQTLSSKESQKRRVLGTMLLLPAHPDQRGSCQLTRARTITTGVMGNATVINSREGNEVTVDSQFSQRKLAFITHLILRSKQVSCARLSRGIWQLPLQKPSSWCGEEKETAKINGIGREGGGRRKHINQEGQWYSPWCVMWWSSKANANYKWGHPLICQRLVRCGFLLDSLMLSGTRLLRHDSITFTSSPLFLCPISFTI